MNYNNDSTNASNDYSQPFAPNSDAGAAKEHAKGGADMDAILAREAALKEEGGVVRTEKQYYQPPPQVEDHHRVENLQATRNQQPQYAPAPNNQPQYAPLNNQQQPQYAPINNQQQQYTQPPPMQQQQQQQQQYNQNQQFMQQPQMPQQQPYSPQAQQPMIITQQQVIIQQPQYQPPPTTMVIKANSGLPGNVMGRFPQNFQCSTCDRAQCSHVSYQIGTGGMAWIIGCLFFCPCASFGPCLSADCQDAVHTCPGCGRKVGHERWLC